MKPASGNFLISSRIKFYRSIDCFWGPLLDWSGVGVNHQMVLNHFPRDHMHLRRLLGKHVDISPEEGDERELLFAVQITRDTGCLTSLSPDLDGLYGDIFLDRWLHAGC
jgi:hypothetical protein